MTLERLLTDHHHGHPSEATFSTSTNHSRSQQIREELVYKSSKSKSTSIDDNGFGKVTDGYLQAYGRLTPVDGTGMNSIL